MERYVIALAVIEQDGKYLVVKRAADQNFAPNRWECISGFLAENETADAAIAREIKEELSVIATLTKMLPVYEVTEFNTNWVIVPFAVQVPPNEIKLSFEHTESAWVSPAELANYNLLFGTRFLN